MTKLLFSEKYDNYCGNDVQCKKGFFACFYFLLFFILVCYIKKSKL